MKYERVLIFAMVALAAIAGAFSPVAKADTVTDRDLSAKCTVTSDFVSFSVPSHVKAAYNTQANGSGKLLGPASEKITIQHGVQTEVPEPGTLALFGIGLLVIGTLIRRRLSA